MSCIFNIRSWPYVKLSKYHRCIGRPPASIAHPKQRGDPTEMGLGHHHTKWIIRLNLSPREMRGLHQLTADSQGSYRVGEPAKAPLLAESQFSSVQSLSRVRLFATPWIAALQVSLSITNSQSLLKLMSIESVMPSSHLILCRPLLLLPSIFPSIRVFPNKSALCMRWPKYWGFSFSISPSNKHPGLISFRMDWLDLLAVQGTLKSLLQHHSSKASIFRRSAFFTGRIYSEPKKV